MALAVPLAIKKLLGLSTAVPATDTFDAPPDDVVLGAKQFPNPTGLQPRLDTEGPPPTRMPTGVSLLAPRNGGSPTMDATNPEPAQLLPGLLREASTKSNTIKVAPEQLKKAAAPAPPDVTAPEAPTPGGPEEAATAASTPNLPSLAPQGSSHAVPAALLRMTGITAAQPKPGELYNGPTTSDEKMKAGLGFAGRLGNALAAAAGTPQQQEIAEQRSEFGPKLTAQTGLAKAQLQSLGAYRQGELKNVADRNDINQQKADQANQQAAAKMRARGYVPLEGSPGEFRSMTADEILADPVLSQKQDLAQAASLQKNAETALAQARRDAIMNPQNPVFQQKERQLQATANQAQANFALRQHSLSNSDERLDIKKGRFGLAEGRQGLSIWQPALESGERLQIMRANLQAGEHGDQQAMLSLLANHLGMTMGLQKGARLNQALIQEAQQSMPWLQGMQAKFDDRGYLTGVTLSPEQMHSMVELGEQRYKTDVQKSRYASQFAGLEEEPQLPIDPESGSAAPMPAALPKNTTTLPRGKGPRSSGASAPASGPLSADEARQYLQKAGGDKDRARALAKQDGRSF